MRSTLQYAQFLEDLRICFNNGEVLRYVFFHGHQPGKEGVTAACLSQWYEASFIVDGQRYQTAEHFMMVEKSALFEDHAARTEILLAPNPRAAKALGRKIHCFDEHVWLHHRFGLVVRANEAKFTQSPQLNQFLKQTGSRILVEASD